MSIQRKNIIYSLFLAIAVLMVWLYRKKTPLSNPIYIYGKTMGTTYHITYFDTNQRNFQFQIDSLLTNFNHALSVYLPDSELTRFNHGTMLLYESPYFLPVLEKSRDITEASQGAFDPTVMPLVDAWGFGPSRGINLTHSTIDSIKKFVGFEKILFNADSVWKTDFRTQLDFGAIAKGYGVDIIVNFIASQGIDNLFVEIGGDVLARGQNLKSNTPWTLGILHPHSTYDSQSYIAYAMLENKAMATSGNYFNYYIKDKTIYTHTLDPKSGYPIQGTLLSTSVIAKDCATADAWATAFMVMGYKKAVSLLEYQDGLGAFLVYSTQDGIATFATQNIKDLLKMHSIQHK